MTYKRSVLLHSPKLNKYRAVPQLFSKPSFTIPAKTNALSAGLITSHDISPEESRTTSSKRVRQSQKDMLNKAKQALLNIKKGKKARKLPCSNNGIGNTLAQITAHNKVAQHFKRAGPKSRSTEIKGTSDIVGWTIQVAFDDGIFPGIIESYDPKDNLYTIKYGDNDVEQLWPGKSLAASSHRPSPRHSTQTPYFLSQILATSSGKFDAPALLNKGQSTL